MFMNIYHYSNATYLRQAIKQEHAQWALPQTALNELHTLERQNAIAPISFASLEREERISAIKRTA